MSITKDLSIRKGDKPMDFKPLPKIFLRKMSVLKSNILGMKPLFREDIVYQSRHGDFLRLADQAEEITLVNKFNMSTSKSHTVAKCVRSGEVVWEKTSECIASIIGQDNYEIVLSSLCSVISQEFKVRAILALLTEPKKSVDKQSQSNQCDILKPKILLDNGVQTLESCINALKKPRPVTRMKRQQSPYVVTDTNVPEKIKKVVIYPDNFDSFTTSELGPVKSENLNADDTLTSELDELNSEHLLMLKCDENSNDSIGNYSSLSVNTTVELLKTPYSLIDEVTEPVQCSSLTMLDGTVINVPCKIEDDFHLATPEILKVVPPENRRKLLWYQAYIDWKYCVTRDDEDNLPIHLAVLNDDVHLLRRQCLVLKTRKESIDITNGDNLTALQISLLSSSPDCTALLVEMGANPLVLDEDYRTCFHLAAEAGSEHLDALFKMCREDPLSILRNSDELWKPEVTTKTKDYQVKYLLDKVCTMFDSQGYTPLMLASKSGKYDAVDSLVLASPMTVDYRATSSGATALYLAAGAAHTDSEQRGNKSKVFDDFKKTLERLVTAGADPNIANYSGHNVNDLLNDLMNSELSMIIASIRTLVNCKNIDTVDDTPFMLIKENDGALYDIKVQSKIRKIEKAGVVKKKVSAKSSNEFLNTYKSFVSNISFTSPPNQDSMIKCRILTDNEKPSSSKFTAKSKPLKLKLTRTAITDPLKIPEKHKKKYISTAELEKIASNVKNVSQTEISNAKTNKRKIIVHADVSFPAPKTVKVEKPSSKKNIKIEDNVSDADET